ncbi:hypothetical protein SAMN05421819_3666 [Bryocella elongata]|uniref:Uncharacterized protein n=1 Tax=Bryocella elongata TaxID=863522 RepID=A0A1H6BFX1_9BACT|nr:hypothetical protein [Bryocella elongata]SEG59464.1 hypothetical protein SAMN05421819_3666 [Bryocella elongata]
MELSDLLFWLIPVGLGAGALAGWWVSRRSKRAWLRWTLRVMAMMVGCACVAIAAFGYFISRFDPYPYPDQVVRSPNGHRVARLRYVALGALGDDMVLLDTRTNWFSSWERVAKWPGTPADGDQIRWGDDQHLVIRHKAIYVSTDHGMSEYKQDSCDLEVDGLKTVCETY